MHDVLIIGSGVIGMSIARHLSATHLDVAVIDRDVPGKHASYKAGGMLGAQNEFTEDSDLFQLAIESRAMLSLIHISEPTRLSLVSRMPSSA